MTLVYVFEFFFTCTKNCVQYFRMFVFVSVCIFRSTCSQIFESSQGWVTWQLHAVQFWQSELAKNDHTGTLWVDTLDSHRTHHHKDTIHHNNHQEHTRRHRETRREKMRDKREWEKREKEKMKVEKNRDAMRFLFARNVLGLQTRQFDS